MLLAVVCCCLGLLAVAGAACLCAVVCRWLLSVVRCVLFVVVVCWCVLLLADVVYNSSVAVCGC